MTFKIMPKMALPDWIAHLNEQYRVVGPTMLHGKYVFDEIREFGQLHLDYTQSVMPPKKYLVPRQETLLTYKLDGSHFEAVIDVVPTVVLGMHTCDLWAVELFDRIFTQSFNDQHFQAHRENTFLISIECLTPCTEHSFCRSMGTLSTNDRFDLHLLDLGREYAVEVGTERGVQLLEGAPGVFEATDADIERINTLLHGKWARFPYRLDLDVTELPGLLTEEFDSEYWNELGEICLACGMCTQVCPTCYCFDIHDESDLLLNQGKRVRTWDSCQIDRFAEVAGGHNFRKTRAWRQRHRFMRKGKYQMEAYGLIGCVGCGRCAESCLVHITPIKTFNELYRRHQEVGGGE